MTKSGLVRMAVFEGKHIRKILHEGEWWFSVIDVIEVLTGSDRPRKYWSDLKKRLASEGYVEVSDKIGQLKMLAPDGKMRLTDCANTETMFRIIQSIPSPKVEPLKRWLAKVGKERIDEIENPELSMERMKSLYEKKGYPKDWIANFGLLSFLPRQPLVIFTCHHCFARTSLNIFARAASHGSALLGNYGIYSEKPIASDQKCPSLVAMTWCRSGSKGRNEEKLI